MFEGWVAEVLATYLGKFIDVQRDRLRISLWGGETWHQRMAVPSHLPMTSDYDERGGARNVAVAGQCVLENVQLRPEAFDYLKLPVAIGAGSVGRLCLKVLLSTFQTVQPFAWRLMYLPVAASINATRTARRAATGAQAWGQSSLLCRCTGIHGFLSHVPMSSPPASPQLAGAAAFTPVLPASAAR